MIHLATVIPSLSGLRSGSAESCFAPWPCPGDGRQGREEATETRGEATRRDVARICRRLMFWYVFWEYIFVCLRGIDGPVRLKGELIGMSMKCISLCMLKCMYLYIVWLELQICMLLGCDWWQLDRQAGTPHLHCVKCPWRRKMLRGSYSQPEKVMRTWWISWSIEDWTRIIYIYIILVMKSWSQCTRDGWHTTPLGDACKPVQVFVNQQYECTLYINICNLFASQFKWNLLKWPVHFTESHVAGPINNASIYIYMYLHMHMYVDIFFFTICNHELESFTS